MKHNLFLILILQCVLSFIVSAQEDFNHPELDWQTFETNHFLIHFHQGTERTAREVAQIAESIYGPITKMYDHEPDQRVSFIIRDHDDYSNGGAYFFDNKIVIYAPSLDFELRGTHPWLWDVVSHEFTHVVELQTALKFGRRMPGIYLQWLGYEAERRPDVLYGYPNVIASYPISGYVVPPWFAEGVAQYNNPNFKYDYWDSHRDMILRMYLIDRNQLSWNEMGCFGKTSLGNESVYNSGFSLVEYIGQKYGADKLLEISKQLSAPFRLTIDGAIEATLGKTGIQLYEEWKAEKTAQYKHLADSLAPTRQEGEIVEKKGIENFYPVFSPDGSKIVYVSNQGEDYSKFCRVYIYDLLTKKSQFLVQTDRLNGIRSSLSFSPDGKFLYYARITRENPHWSAYSDLYRYNFITQEEERLTYGLRALNPRLSPDGKKIVFATGSDGTLNIGVCDADGKNIDTLTKFKNGDQVYTPVWSKDGKKIAFGYSIGHNQSVAIMDTDGRGFQMLQHSGDCRDPFFASDSVLYYSWDQKGIFNIYRMNLRTGTEMQATNVLGSAFLPSLNDSGDLAYVTYTSSGYKISFLDQDSMKNLLSIMKPQPITTVDLSGREGAVSKLDLDRQLPSSIHSEFPVENRDTLQSKTYKSKFTSLSLIPLVRFDNYNESGSTLDKIKAGLYVSSSDVVDMMDLFGGAAINKSFERDLFLIINYKYRVPLLYQLGLEPIASLEAYNITRKRDVSFPLTIENQAPDIFHATVTYNLFEFDFSLHQKIISELLDLKLLYTLDKYNQDFGSWVHPDPRIGVVKATSSTYLISNIFSLQMKYVAVHPEIDEYINPVGRSFSLKYFYEMSKFNPTNADSLENGFRVPLYTKYNLNRVELNWIEHIALPLSKHTLTLGVNADGILGPAVDEFFDYYAGGFVGMRGYPFYAIGGNKTMTLNATYRFPIATELDFRVLQIYFKKLYGSIFYDIGDGWSDKTPSINRWKRDVGFELRLETFSFYAYPTRIFFSGAYGLDRFTRNIKDITTTTVQYGHEWRFYLGVLFGFELNDILPRQFMR